MARTTCRPPAPQTVTVMPIRETCWQCGGPLWMKTYRRRTVTTLTGLQTLRLGVRHCIAPSCPQYHQPYRPEAEGALVLPHHEVGLDVIALVGRLRVVECRSVPEIHQTLRARGVAIAERTVTHLIARYEELVALTHQERRPDLARLKAQGAVVLALDGLQPDVGHEVLWIVRDVLSGTILVTKCLLSATEAEVVTLLEDALARLPPSIIVRGVISDGQHSIRNAVRTALPGIPHQLCQFHYLREAARPIFEADRHAKKELKKRVRGVRPMERALDTAPQDAVTEAARGYCLAVRSALTDDGRPPLAASGLRLHERLQAIATSLDHVTTTLTKKGGPFAPSSRAYTR